MKSKDDKKIFSEIEKDMLDAVNKATSTMLVRLKELIKENVYDAVPEETTLDPTASAYMFGVGLGGGFVPNDFGSEEGSGGHIKYMRLGKDGGLMGSFVASDAKIVGDKVVGEVYYDETLIYVDPVIYTHGSYEWYTTDISDIFPYLVIEGKSGELFGRGWWTEPRDFWTPFIEEIENGNFDHVLSTELFKLKVSYKK